MSRSELDLGLLEQVDRPGEIEPDHVGLVAAALTYPRLPDVRHEAESR